MFYTRCKEHRHKSGLCACIVRQERMVLSLHISECIDGQSKEKEVREEKYERLFEEKLAILPDQPGCYLMKDKKERSSM